MITLTKEIYRVEARLISVENKRMHVNEKWCSENTDFTSFNLRELKERAEFEMRWLEKNMVFPFNSDEWVSLFVIQKARVKCELDDGQEVNLDRVESHPFHYFNVEDKSVGWKNVEVYASCTFSHYYNKRLDGIIAADRFICPS